MKKNYFKGRTLVIATNHGKEKVMKEILDRELEVTAIVPADFNTDIFGTFTKDIRRTNNQLVTARNKAIAAMKHGNTNLVVSSEGSFGLHPSTPFMTSNIELVLLIDRLNDLEISGYYISQNTNASGRYIKTMDEAREFASKCGFPEHGIILRNGENGKKIYKGIRTFQELEQRFKDLSGFFFKKIYVETDMRAHMNPTRMENIRHATLDLIKNIKRTCVKCGTPGFTIVEVKEGLPCNNCNKPTDLHTYSVYSCKKCNHKEKSPRQDGLLEADPEHCNHCNP